MYQGRREEAARLVVGRLGDWKKLGSEGKERSTDDRERSA
jgi:hypothetical protein